MGWEKINVSNDELKRIFNRVDKHNYMDFSTLKELIENEFNNKDIWYDVCEYLQTELGFASDGDLYDITDDEIENIVDIINNGED